MRILANGFPTNLPDSEIVSQGGPANFAKLFINYIIANHPEHRWVGVMLERGTDDARVKIERIFNSNFRTYFRLTMPAKSMRSITRARSKKADASIILSKPIRRLTALMQEEKPDVVFLNGFGLLNWMLLKAAEAANIPVVIQHAGIWTRELELHKDVYSTTGRALMEQMERDSSRIAAVEIFLNEWSKDYYRTHVADGSPRRTEVISLPFDFSSFRQLSTGAEGVPDYLDSSKVNIGIVARWDEIKNHAAFCAMAKEAKRRNLPWRFNAVVNIPDTERYAKEKKEYERYVNVISPMNRAGISQFSRSMDMLVLPSVFDVSPTVVLEAIALDTPIVISPTVGYVREFEAAGASEWIIDPSDTSRAVDVIEDRIGKRMPATLHNRLREAHDLGKVFSAYLDIFAGARVRGLPLRDVIRLLWRQEMQRYFAVPHPMVAQSI